MATTTWIGFRPTVLDRRAVGGTVSGSGIASGATLTELVRGGR